MHFAISTTWGPTDPTRAMLPFLFAAAAVQAANISDDQKSNLLNNIQRLSPKPAN